MASPTSVQLDDAMIARLDAVALALSERAGGVRVSRSAAIRAVIDRGLQALEAELRIKPKRT